MVLIFLLFFEISNPGFGDIYSSNLMRSFKCPGFFICQDTIKKTQSLQK